MIDREIVMANYGSFMNLTESLEKLAPYNNGLGCLLKNRHEAADYFYNQSHGRLWVGYSRGSVSLHISSIDDGSITFLGPSESEEAGANRIKRLVQEIESWDGWIPTVEQCEKVVRNCGVFWNR